MATPIENILVPLKNRLERTRLESLEFCQELGIKTMEELTTYNRFAFSHGGNKHTQIYFLDTVSRYLEDCLKKKGLSFAEKPIKKTAFESVGKQNMKEYLFDALIKLSKDSLRSEMIFQAKDALREKIDAQLKESDWGVSPGTKFVCDIFGNKTRIYSLIEELVIEGKAEKHEKDNHFYYHAIKSSK